jgi:formyltetrahydrofolate-dependent phosphoribosylglycinamide formyltransferase
MVNDNPLLETFPHNKPKTVPRLGVLISGRGSNLKAIVQAIQAKTLLASVEIVLASHQAAGIAIAHENGIEGLTIESQMTLPADLTNPAERAIARDQVIVGALQRKAVHVVILAGYHYIVGSAILKAYPDRILNIHPSLLPAYGGKGMYGMAVHKAVIANGESQSGCTVHLVNNVIDGGKLLGQQTVPVLPTDTPEDLAARILTEEHLLYPRVIQAFCESSAGINFCPEQQILS